MHAIAKALQLVPRGRHLLAVSGGRDSMVLLHAFAEYRRDAITAVATFDHGTGEAAEAAVRLVERTCLERGIPVASGRMSADAGPSATAQRSADGVQRTAHSFHSKPNSEATWRSERWSFLRAVADEHHATIATAHSLDDQAETVAMRLLRGASARGLAGMAIRTKGVLRPLLAVTRMDIAEYAAAHGVAFIDDPSNADPRHQRNRLRSDLLAAASAVRPTFVADLIAIGTRAAEWRRDVAALVDELGLEAVGQSLVLSAARLEGIDVTGLAVLWPEIAGRLGITLDRRGVARASAWALTARAGQRMPLSGGASIERTARTFVLRSN